MESLRIALAGLGTVGAETLRLLQENAAVIAARAGRPVIVTAVSARNRQKTRSCSLEGILWADNPLELAAFPDADVVVELIGGAEGVARALCETALRNGKHVVTANKALLAAHGMDLAKLAEESGRQLMFEAAVAGGIPVIKTLREALAGNTMLAVQGILNGTCNYILTRMAGANLDFDEALKEAQAAGYAEADPGMDVDGHDTAHKLAILAALAFGAPPDLESITVEGLRRVTPLDLTFAAELGCRIKLLGTARFTKRGLEQRVGPCLVPETSPLAAVDHVLNAVMFHGSAAGPVTLVGRGAGGAPTASAVIADIIDIARGSAVRPFGIPVAASRPLSPTPPAERLSSWYVRLKVVDQPGVVADISAILRDEAISIESMLQHGRSRTDSVPVIIVTHEVNEAAMRRAVNKMVAVKSVREEPCLMRMENG
ncbi:MAG: homoserine dehydrogenase [Alphaproteobacteria bacterium]|nr:homoserine dehydrogenase [Alphaproteobacteria bacterium]